MLKYLSVAATKLSTVLVLQDSTMDIVRTNLEEFKPSKCSWTASISTCIIDKQYMYPFSLSKESN